MARSIRLRRVLLIGFALLPSCAAPKPAEKPSQPAGAIEARPTTRFAADWAFRFDAASGQPGIPADASPYSDARGYGFETIANAPPGSPHVFSAAVPEGTYRVTLWLGGVDASNNTIKAESRQLMLHNVSTRAGETVEKSFFVNVRSPWIDADARVKLQASESVLRWDGKLSLEFNGTSPHVAALRIERVEHVKTVYLVGDSTVCDHPAGPLAGWGQMLPAFCDLSRVVVSNHAENGQSYRKFLRENRWDKVRASLRPGDVVIFQMGHNDQQEAREGDGAFTTFAAWMKRLVAETRARGATPVLVTPMHRKKFDAAGKLIEIGGDYPPAVRQVAKELNVPLVELRDASATLYESLGPAGCKPLFVDETHHTDYGAYLLARCVADSLMHAPPDVSGILRAGLPPFDPAHPPTQAGVAIPVSPQSR